MKKPVWFICACILFILWMFSCSPAQEIMATYAYRAQDTRTIQPTNTIRSIYMIQPTEEEIVTEIIIRTVERNAENILYFRFNDDPHGYELWKSDGTEAGTGMVKDIYPGENSSAYYGEMLNFKDLVLFKADDGIHGNELWKSDGTEAGTVMVKDIYTVSGAGKTADPLLHIQWLTALDDFVLFQATDMNGTGIWKTDGTAEGTVLVMNFGASTPQYFVRAGSTLFFFVRSGISGDTLWKSDGTEAGTGIVKDISSGETGSRIATMMELNGSLIFAADDGIHGYELWKSDGTEAGTVMIKDGTPGPEGTGFSDGYAIPHALVFLGGGVWRSDGTEIGTYPLSDAQLAGSTGFSPLQVDQIIYFNSFNDRTGTELWKSDGTIAGTGLVKNINEGEAGSEPSYYSGVNGKLLFWADDGSGVMESWISDGTADGTKKLNLPFTLGTRENSVFNHVRPVYYGEINGRLLFNLYDQNSEDPNEKRIWITDGTEAGTGIFKDFN